MFFKPLGYFRTCINIKFTQIRYRLRSNLKVILRAISFPRITSRFLEGMERFERLLFTSKLTHYHRFQGNQDDKMYVIICIVTFKTVFFYVFRMRYYNNIFHIFIEIYDLRQYIKIYLNIKMKLLLHI